MNSELRIETYGPVIFTNGVPSQFSYHILPQASCFQANGPWGAICYQEIKTEYQILRYFLFLFNETLSIFFREKNEGVQTIINLRGEVLYHIGENNTILLKEKEYTLLNALEENSWATFQAGRFCSFFNTYYHPNAYQSLLRLFPSFKKEVEQSFRKAKTFLYPPKVARFSVHDTIKAIWLDQYTDALMQKHVEIRLKQSFFTILAQTYTPNNTQLGTQVEREIAFAAQEIILRDITVRIPNKAIAAELNCSVGFLKRAFSKVYGIGLYHFLRKTRMNEAKQMLLTGMSLKAVALEVGMRPKNFPKEFKAFHGYTVSQLKKGLDK